MQSPVGSPRKKTAAFLVAAAFAIFALVDIIAFRTPLYRRVLDPASTTGSFEAAIAQFRAFPAQPSRDVLVLGDSRTYSGLDPAAAAAGAGGKLRFLNAGVPGTTPRCWPFFVRAIDPEAHRYRAVVIPVDTFSDDDSAIGSLDGDDRPMDLRYVVFQTRLTDLPKLAGSFSDPRERIEYGIDLFWRGAELRDDFQNLAADPPARAVAIAQARRNPAYEPLAAHPRTETLAGLRANFATNTLDYPANLTQDQRDAIATQVLRAAKPSPSYAKYRLQWLAPIAARYAETGTPVFFVRIPTRPVHRFDTEAPSGSLVQIAQTYHAQLLPAEPFLALERPDLFADEDHLNRAGSLQFSRLLGERIASALSPRPMTAAAEPTTAPPTTAAATPVATPSSPPPPSPPPAPREHRDLSWYAAAIGIGIPLRFQSYEFWLFFAIVAALFYGLPRRYGRYVLLVASYYFYARWNAWYVLFLWILTVSDFLIGSRAGTNARSAKRIAASARGRHRRQPRLPRKLQVSELCEHDGCGASRDASKPVAGQSFRADWNQLPHLPEHFVFG